MLSRKGVGILALALAMAVALPILVYAYRAYLFNTTQPTRTPGGIVVVQSSAQIGLYWDPSCTSRVTFIDFGQAGLGARLFKYIYIKNQGNVNIQLCWNSTLQDQYWAPNSPKTIWDSWNGDIPEGTTINGTILGPGQVLGPTYYGVKVETYASLGTYNWTLTAWGIY